MLGPAHDDDRPGLHLRQRHDVDDLPMHGAVGRTVRRRNGERHLHLRLVVHREPGAAEALDASQRRLAGHRQSGGGPADAARERPDAREDPRDARDGKGDARHDRAPANEYAG